MILRTIMRVFSFAKPWRLSLVVSVIAILMVIGINLYAPMLARE